MANICGLCTCAATRKEYNLYQKTKSPRGLIGKPEALARRWAAPPGGRDSTTEPARRQATVRRVFCSDPTFWEAPSTDVTFAAGFGGCNHKG